MVDQVEFPKDLPYFVVGLILKRVNIFSDCALEEEWLLRNEGDVLSEGVKSQFADVLVVYQDFAFV